MKVTRQAGSWAWLSGSGSPKYTLVFVLMLSLDLLLRQFRTVKIHSSLVVFPSMDDSAASSSVYTANSTTSQSWNNVNNTVDEKNNRTIVSENGPLPQIMANESRKLKPLNCSHFLRQVREGTTHHPTVPRDPNEGQNVTVLANGTHNPFWVSLFTHRIDGVRWDIYRYGRYYERALENIWTNILLKEAEPGSRVVDAGGNIGYYALLSASLGRGVVVDSFEPNLKNNIRFCESLALNGWSQHNETSKLRRESDRASVNIYPYGLSDKAENLTFLENPGNPGAGMFIGGGVQQQKQQQTTTPRARGYTLEVITLDDFAEERGWFQSRPNISILKIDAERHEARVLLGAKRLIRERMVQNVFTEAALTSDRHVEREALVLLVNAGYKLEGFGGFRGPEEKTTALPSSWHHDKIVDWLFDTLESRRMKNKNFLFFNLWWKLYK